MKSVGTLSAPNQTISYRNTANNYQDPELRNEKVETPTQHETKF